MFLFWRQDPMLRIDRGILPSLASFHLGQPSPISSLLLLDLSMGAQVCWPWVNLSGANNSSLVETFENLRSSCQLVMPLKTTILDGSMDLEFYGLFRFVSASHSHWNTFSVVYIGVAIRSYKLLKHHLEGMSAEHPLIHERCPEIAYMTKRCLWGRRAVFSRKSHKSWSSNV